MVSEWNTRNEFRKTVRRPADVKVTFKEVIQLAEQLNMNGSFSESFTFSCRAKNLTQSTLKCYAERLEYLVRYAASISKELHELTQKDIQSYLMKILDTVSAATVNRRIRVFKVFFTSKAKRSLTITLWGIFRSFAQRQR
ncbi:MAG: phage integrase N-terminal SAM-like domain-containing protein [bacterium]|nr:phage integrase N-terminal SAM-like domain-containing protein [bacterium]